MSHYVDLRHFVLMMLACTMTTIEKITIFCIDVNKTSTSTELLSILRYMSYRSNVGLEIKSTTGHKIFVKAWNGYNAFVHPLNCDELL